MSQIFDQEARVVGVEVTNRLARNTFSLLALSMVPTVLGSLVGMKIGFMFTGWVSLILFMVGSIVMQMLIARNANSGTGVVLLLVYTFFMGFMLSSIFNALFLTLSNAGEIILLASLGTLVSFGVTALVASMSRTDYGQRLVGSSSGFRWGSILGIGLGVLMVFAIGSMIFHSPLMYMVYSSLGLIVFTLFMLVDLQRVVRQTGNQNYVLCTLNLYLDLLNIFVMLLNLLSMFAGNRRD